MSFEHCCFARALRRRRGRADLLHCPGRPAECRRRRDGRCSSGCRCRSSALQLVRDATGANSSVRSFPFSAVPFLADLLHGEITFFTAPRTRGGGGGRRRGEVEEFVKAINKKTDLSVVRHARLLRDVHLRRPRGRPGNRHQGEKETTFAAFSGKASNMCSQSNLRPSLCRCSRLNSQFH